MCNKNIPLERRAKIAATIDMIVSSINIVVHSISLRDATMIIDDSESSEDDKEEARLSRYLLIILIVIASTKLVMGVVLWMGATKRNSTYVRAWLVIAIILWIIHLSDYIGNLVKGTFQLLTTITTGFTLVIRCIVFVIITLFIREIENEDEDDTEVGVAIRPRAN